MVGEKKKASMRSGMGAWESDNRRGREEAGAGGAVDGNNGV